MLNRYLPRVVVIDAKSLTRLVNATRDECMAEAEGSIDVASLYLAADLLNESLLEALFDGRGDAPAITIRGEDFAGIAHRALRAAYVSALEVAEHHNNGDVFPAFAGMTATGMMFILEDKLFGRDGD